MVVFPIIACLVSLACAVVVGRDAVRDPKPDRVVWTVAFVTFAIAAGAEVVGSLTEWSPALVRVFYLTGAVLVVGYLALGELYLLIQPKIERFAPGAALLVTALAATLVISAPVDESKLSTEAWESLERGAALTLLTVLLNAGGTIVLVGGALYSARRFHKLGIHRHRMIGCILIAVGTLAVASGGTLTRLGEREYFYVAMSIGIILIFAGVLETRRPDRTAAGVGDRGLAPGLVGKPALQLVRKSRSAAEVSGNDFDEAVAYIESRLLTLPDDERDALCTMWSVARKDIEVFAREEARLVWRLRVQLSDEARERFDDMSACGQLQVAELHDEVLTSHLAMSS